ncbi:MAG: hypothetical protein IJK97_13010, partial [Thermoguttaceae bacterium]|nr:hypothetical protein [Thermoguttaceae bacterium]
GKEGSAEVNVNGFNQNMTTLDIQTSTFVGGAHETWLAGDQYLQETMDDGQLIYTFRDKTSGLSGNFKMVSVKTLELAFSTLIQVKSISVTSTGPKL